MCVGYRWTSLGTWPGASESFQDEIAIAAFATGFASHLGLFYPQRSGLAVEEVHTEGHHRQRCEKYFGLIVLEADAGDPGRAGRAL